MDNVDMRKLLAAHDWARDDVEDFIDEHPIEHLIAIDNKFVSRLEKLWSKYRKVHLELLNLVNDDNDGKINQLKEEFEALKKSIKVRLFDVKSVEIAMQNAEANHIAVKRDNEARVKSL